MIRRPPRSTPFPTRRSSDLDEAVLGRDHVLVGVARESRAQPVARLGGAAVSDVVGQDQVVRGGIERSAGAVQLAGEQRRQELRARPARAVENQDGVAHPTSGIAPRLAERAVVQSQLGQQDRKSTRLNSSHGYISYAVFCLKKKKKTTISHTSNQKSPQTAQQ